jgi:uncharacterized protein
VIGFKKPVTFFCFYLYSSSKNINIKTTIKLNYMKTCQQIKTVLEAYKPQLLKKYPIEELGIFGSYARNEQNSKSDVDIIVKFNGYIGLRFVDLIRDIEKKIGVNVDLVEKDALKPKLKTYIEKDLIYV